MKEEVEKYLNQNKTMSFKDLLFYYVKRSKLKNSDVYKMANVDRRIFSKIKCYNYVPRKNMVIRLCLSLKLNLNETNTLLKKAGYSLNDSDSDLVISYFIENEIYDIYFINDYLFTNYNTSI